MKDKLLKILHSGVFAPSADNQHVFQAEILDSAIRLWPSDAFSSTINPIRLTLGLVSIGAVIENMRIEALALGLNSNISWLYEHNNSGPFAELKFHTIAEPIFDEFASAVPHRHTNRRMYQGSKLEEHQISALNDAATGVDGVQLTWLTGNHRKKALQLIWSAESERFLQKSLHEDLFSSIRFDLKWSETSKTLLPPGALDIEAPMRPIFKALRNWYLMRPLTSIGLHHIIGLRAGFLPCWQAPALGLFTTTGGIEKGAVNAGAALQRVWLKATLLGIAMQPLAASCMFALPNSSGQGPSDELRSFLVSGWEEIAPGRLPMMVFRVGKAASPSIRTARPPVNQYIRTKLGE